MKTGSLLFQSPGFRPVSLGFALAVSLLLSPESRANPAPVDLGTAAGFAVLAGSGITVTGPTTITGDIGSHPVTSMTGLANVTLTGVNHGGDAVTAQAKNDLVTAYNDAAGRTFDAIYGGGYDLVGLTLAPGVYHASSSLFLSGTLTLDGQGDPEAVWIFQTGSSLITASDSLVDLIGSAQACHVFWQVGSSATLGTGTDFVGSILALESITLNTGASVDGRVLARNGAVTLDHNAIVRPVCADDQGTPANVPEGGNTLALLGAGAAGLAALGRRFAVRA